MRYIFVTVTARVAATRRVRSCNTCATPSAVSKPCAVPTARGVGLLQAAAGLLSTVHRTGRPRLPAVATLEVNGMKTKFLAAVAAATLMALTGCGSIDRNTAGTVGGAVAGGALGSAV